MNKGAIIKTVIGLSLMLGGAGYLYMNQTKDERVKATTEQLVKETTVQNFKENKEKEATYNFDDVKPASTASSIQAEMSTDEAVIGRIEVPSVKLDLPIIKGITDSGMYKGAGTMKKGQEMGKGNYALASHHMKDPSLLFSPLDRVEKGQEIKVSDDTGTYTYKIVEKRVISAKDVYVIDEVEGHTLITLITCHAKGEDRLMVQGELVK